MWRHSARWELAWSDNDHPGGYLGSLLVTATGLDKAAEQALQRSH